ncbi:nucleotide exchange factor GrpE [bacterium]|nr:nucleotide exchange factor GrpE [bacterium]
MANTNSNPFKNEDLVKDEENLENNDISDTVEVEEASKEEVSEENDNKLQEEYDKLNQQYVRLAADFDNYRKRQAQERESLIKFGTENALKNLLEVLDNFERGQKALENVDDCEKVKESFSLIHKQVFESLAKLGLEEIKAIGEEFDPNFHEAVMQTPTDEHPENTVIAELQKGYKVGDKVLRPTLVNVASAKG